MVLRCLNYFGMDDRGGVLNYFILQISQRMSEVFDSEKQLGRASELVRQVEKYWIKRSQSKPPDYEVALFVGTPFGIHRVSNIFAMGTDTIMISVITRGKRSSTLFVPIEQCAFMFEIFQPTPEKSRVIVGFAQPKDEGTT